MTAEELIKANELIDQMVGSRNQQRELVADMELAERLNSNREYEKMRTALLKIAEKYGEEVLLCSQIQYRGWSSGVTKNGKKFVWEGNNGWTVRSRYCGSLWIEGLGTVFTSGTVAKACEYILNN